MILSLLINWVLAGATEDVRHQQDVVAQAAATVAQARAEGMRSRDIAVLMASYRQEAELLAKMTPPPADSGEATARVLALRTLAEATALGQQNAAARGVIAAWLGALDVRLSLLEGALSAVKTTAVRAPDLAQSMALDIENQCSAVMIAAAYDATQADALARSERLHLAMLRQAETPQDHGGMGHTADTQVAEAAILQAETQAAFFWDLRLRANQLRTQVRELLGMEVVP